MYVDIASKKCAALEASWRLALSRHRSFDLGYDRSVRAWLEWSVHLTQTEAEDAADRFFGLSLHEIFELMKQESCVFVVSRCLSRLFLMDSNVALKIATDAKQWISAASKVRKMR